MLSREAIEETLARWFRAWNEQDLDRVMELFHDEVIFEHWTGATVRGKKSLRRAWTPWFAGRDGFRFVEEDTFIDVSEQKVLYRWLLEWTPPGKEAEAGVERRRGVDVLHFAGQEIIEKLTYSKTAVENEAPPASLPTGRLDGEQTPGAKKLEPNERAASSGGT